MRTNSCIPLLLGLVLSIQVTESKPRFGMLFQMNKQGEHIVTTEKMNDKDEDLPIEHVCVDQTVLQAQLDHAKNRLAEKEREAVQQQAKLTDQVTQLQTKLAEAESKLQKQKGDTKKDTASPSDAKVMEDLAAKLEAQRLEMEDSFKAESYELRASLQQAQRSLEESVALTASLQARIDEYEAVVDDMLRSSAEKEKEWKATEQKIMEVSKQLEKALQAANKEKASHKDVLRRSQENAAFWETAFHHRSYINVTHWIEFADVLATAVSAPIIEVARSTYQEHLKGGVSKATEATKTAYQNHVTPLSEKYIAPMYEKHVAHSVEVTREKVVSLWRELIPLLRSGWSKSLEVAVRTTQLSCEASSSRIQDGDRRAKVQKLCDDPTPFVITLISLPLALVFCRVLLWLILLPIKILLLLSPIRFSELGIQEDQPEAVSAKEMAKG